MPSAVLDKKLKVCWVRKSPSPDNKVKWAFLKFTLGTRQRTLGLVAG